MLLTAFLLVALVSAPASAAKGKFREDGDAPDRQLAYGEESMPIVTAPVDGIYPSVKRRGGPQFKSPKLRLGGQADTELDSQQVNVDQGEDGIKLSHVPCQEVTYRFTVDVSGKKKSRRGKAFLNLLIDIQVSSGGGT